jgi:hypothetical protein
VDHPPVERRGVPSFLNQKKTNAGGGTPAKEGTAMLSVMTTDDAQVDSASMLDEICREGARAMLAVALEAEANA